MNRNIYKYNDMKRSEHMAVRTTCGFYLWTHQILEVTGEDAAKFLDYVFPASISALKVGRERYTTMLDHNAEIIDDVVVLRMESEKFWVSTLFVFYMMGWFAAHMEGYKIEFKNITNTLHMFAVQGPKSLEVVNDLVEKPVDDLKFFSFMENSIDGNWVLINRAGYTGEKFGYEIYIAADKLDYLENKLREAVKKVDGKQVTDFQLMAWTLPTEAGYFYMRDLRHLNPFEANLTGNINWEKDFIGKEALLKVKNEGPKLELVGFTMEEADCLITGKDYGRNGSLVTFEDEVVGEISKWNYSYVLEKPIGYILADKGAIKPGDKVVINKRYEAEITAPKFI